MTKARRLYAATFLLALLVALATKHSAVTGTEVARAGGAPTVAALQASGSIDVPDDLTFASKYLAPDEKLRLAGKSNGVSWYLANGRYGETCLLAARDADAADGMSCWVKDDLERGRMWSALQLDAERWEVAVLLPDGYSIRATGPDSPIGLRKVAPNLAIAEIASGARFELVGAADTPTLTVQVPKARSLSLP